MLHINKIRDNKDAFLLSDEEKIAKIQEHVKAELSKQPKLS